MNIVFKNLSDHLVEELSEKVALKSANANNRWACQSIKRWAQSCIYEAQELESVIVGDSIMYFNASKMRAVTFENTKVKKVKTHLSLENYNTLTEADIIDMVDHIIKYYFIDDSADANIVISKLFLYNLILRNLEGLVTLEDVLNDSYSIAGVMSSEVLIKVKESEANSEEFLTNSIWGEIEEIINQKDKEYGK